jgi:hypothetical protein
MIILSKKHAALMTSPEVPEDIDLREYFSTDLMGGWNIEFYKKNYVHAYIRLQKELSPGYVKLEAFYGKGGMEFPDRLIVFRVTGPKEMLESIRAFEEGGRLSPTIRELVDISYVTIKFEKEDLPFYIPLIQAATFEITKAAYDSLKGAEVTGVLRQAFPPHLFGDWTYIRYGDRDTKMTARLDFPLGGIYHQLAANTKGKGRPINVAILMYQKPNWLRNQMPQVYERLEKEYPKEKFGIVVQNEEDLEIARQKIKEMGRTAMEISTTAFKLSKRDK